MNYFELLNIEQKYDIDLLLLKKQYLAMQALYHPDRIADESARKNAVEKSILINEAYNILKDDYLRAEYFLKLYGIKFDEITLKDNLSQSELEEIMYQLEIIDNTDSLSSLQEMERIKLLEKQQMVTKISEYLKENKLQQALDLTIRMKYLTNLVGNIKLKIKDANN